jgi:hypothetical protein
VHSLRIWSSEPQLLHVRRSTLGHWKKLDRAEETDGELSTYILGEVTVLVALAAFDVVKVGLFRAVGRAMTLLTAVPASVWVLARLRAVTRTMAFVLAVNTSNGRLLGYAFNLLFLAVLADVAKLAAVATHGNTNVLNKASRLETLKVLSSILGPAFRLGGATRLGGFLETQNVLAARKTSQIDDSHVPGQILWFHGDQVKGDVLVSKSLFDSYEAELLAQGTSIGLECETKEIHVLVRSGVDEGLPGVVGIDLGNTGPVNLAAARTNGGNKSQYMSVGSLGSE